MYLSNGWYYGAAFFLDVDGERLLVTAAHNVLLSDRNNLATEIYAAVNPTAPDKTAVSVRCVVIGVAGQADIALLRPTWAGSGLQGSDVEALELAAEAPSYGQACYLVGNPLAIETCSPSEGLIRDTNFTFYNLVESVIVSAPAYGGNSGGPVLVVDDEGEASVVSILSFGFYDAPTISWGASWRVLRHVVDEIHRTNGNFIGGHLGPGAYTWLTKLTGGWHGHGTAITGADVVGSPDASTNLSTDDKVYEIQIAAGDIRRVGAYPGESSLVELHLKPDVLFPARVNGGWRDIRAIALGSAYDAPLTYATEEHPGAGAIDPSRAVCVGPVRVADAPVSKENSQESAQRTDA
jgi:hypothetical protein